MLQEYRVWDVTTRVFHWLNVLCVIALIALGTAILNHRALGLTNDGETAVKVIHTWVGYVFGFNLLWRLVWGFIGGPYARWRAVLPFRPGYGAELKAELSAIGAGRKANHLGHTPLGRIAVTVLLLALSIQGVSGIILAGTDLYMPPFGKAIAARVAAAGVAASQVRPGAPDKVDPEAFKAMRAMRAPVSFVHTNLFFVLLGLIVLHIFAVVLTDVKRGGNIISAMFSGRKVLADPPADPPV